MDHPTFYASGYPTAETEEAIKAWPMENPQGLLEFVKEAWNETYGRFYTLVGEDGELIAFVTGGWSGNESIINALLVTSFWAQFWFSSERGGRHVFDLEGIRKFQGSLTPPAPEG